MRIDVNTDTGKAVCRGVLVNYYGRAGVELAFWQGGALVSVQSPVVEFVRFGCFRSDLAGRIDSWNTTDEGTYIAPVSPAALGNGGVAFVTWSKDGNPGASPEAAFSVAPMAEEPDALQKLAQYLSS